MTLPTPLSIKKQFPLEDRTKAFLRDAKLQAQKISLDRASPLLFVLGPCSIHDQKSALDFAKEVQELQKAYPQFFFVMRLFVEKARSTTGWKGLLYDPGLDGSNDMVRGIYEVRSLFTEISSMDVPIATEFVNPLLASYFSDLVTWGFIGARTSASQPHREFSSSVDFPIGFKNMTDGDIKAPIQGVLAANHPQSYGTVNDEGRLSLLSSSGNPYTHVVLRGSDDKENFDELSIYSLLAKQAKKQIKSRILVDCSHGNSSREAENQKRSFQAVLEQILNGNQEIMGWMIESNLFHGKQPLELPLQYGISVTDSCLSISETKELIQLAAEALPNLVAVS